MSAAPPLRVLILEDSDSDAELVQRALRGAGIVGSWRQARDERTFCSALGEFAPDLILADYMLPGFGGAEAVAIAHAWDPTVPCILVSGMAGEELAVAALHSGATDYVLKGRLESLPRAVERAREEAAGHRERRRLEAERERLAAAVEQSNDGVLILNADGAVVYANEALLAANGMVAGSVIGRSAREGAALLGLADDVDLRQLVGDGRPWLGEVDRRHGDGSTLNFEVSVAPSWGSDGALAGYVAISRDVTSLRAAQVREHELEEQLAQSEKMEAIGKLAGGIAHDFNNLLTAILGYASLLGQQLSAQSIQAGDLGQIVAAAERAQRLTSQLLAFGRRTILQPRPVEIGALLGELEPMLTRLLGEDVELQISVAADVPRIVVDPGQLEQAVVNLVLNARDAAPGGTIRVETSHRVIAEGDGQGPVGDWAVIDVSDAGVGIAPENLARIFEPFFTTKGVGAGTGLGLSMVDGFVRMSHGHVRVTSAPGAGTTFSLFLPAAGEVAAASAPADEPAATQQRTGTILVVEDEPALRDLAQRALTRAGHRVILAASGEAALEVAAAHEGAIDVLFTDVVMPGIGGPALAEKLRSLRPGIRVVIASGYADDEFARRGICLAGEGFLEKPYSVGALQAAVARALA